MTRFERVSEDLRRRGVSIKLGAGEYVLRHKNGGEEIREEDIEKAYEAGLKLALNPPPEPEPPMGPLPNPHSMRSTVRRHNVPIARKRARRGRNKDGAEK